MPRALLLCLLGLAALASGASSTSAGTPAKNSRTPATNVRMSDSTRLLWLDVRTPQGSDLSDWAVLQAERLFAAESGFQVITRAERLQAASYYALQTDLRSKSPDSLYRSERKPDFTIRIDFSPIRSTDGRAGLLFFMGRRTMRAEVSFALLSERGDMPPVQGEIKRDTSWTLDYCGMLECVNKPLSATERLPVERSLVGNVLTTVHERLNQVLTVPLRERRLAEAQQKALPPDSLGKKQAAAPVKDSAKAAKP